MNTNNNDFPNTAYQGEVQGSINGVANCYYPIPNYPNWYYQNYPNYPTQYPLAYPIYQTDPKVIELLEAIKQLLEKK